MLNVLLAVKDSVINNVVAKLYGNLGIRVKYFKGTVDLLGETMAWSIDAQPSVSFTPVDPKWIKQATASGFQVDPNKPDYFLINLDNFNIGGSYIDLKLLAFCQITGEQSKISAAALLYTDSANDNDKAMVGLIGKLIIANLNAMLPALDIPKLQGLSFPGYTCSIANSMFYFANSAIDTELLTGEREALLYIAPDVVTQLVNTYSGQFSPKSVSGSGKQNLGITTASYNYNASATYAGCNCAGNTLSVGFSIGAGASAGLSTLFGEVGVNYTGSAKPNPVTASATVLADGSTLRVRIDSVQVFGVSLAPHGSVAEKIFSGVLYPLAAIIVNIIVPAITSCIHNITFNVAALVYSTKIFGQDIHFSLQNSAISNSGGFLKVAADVIVS
jgi:hypothetical protein